MGFRYAPFGVPKSVKFLEVKRAIPISSVPEAHCRILPGEELVERLVLNTIWSQRGNFIEVPTDCPTTR